MLTKEKKLEYLDKIISVMKAQGEYAYVDGTCSYRVNRDPAGCRCAAGALIPDEHYDPVFEGLSVNSFFNMDGLPITLPSAQEASAHVLRVALEKSGISFDLDTLRFLRLWQIEHDSAADQNLPFSDFLLNLDLARSKIASEETAPTS